ncbi:MAG: rod shape-determining protein MreD [Acutalibacteraceae bacterium]|nr:rod shape-determining protein MreD [Acutalibacteraceae bacterium]
MQTKKHHPWINLISFLLFFFAFIIHYTDIVDISIKNAQPIIILPLLTAFSMFNSVGASAAVGLIMGIFMDSCASGTVCFNAAVLMISAAMISVCAERLFNRNIRSAALLCLLTNLFYFLLRFVCFYAFGTNAQDNLTYLLSYAFPSIIYTVVFIFPFYFLYRYFYRLSLS